MNIPGGGNVGLFPKVSRQSEVVYLSIQQSFNTFESVQWFGFRQVSIGSGKIKPISSGGTVRVVQSHLNMGIGVGIDGNQIR